MRVDDDRARRAARREFVRTHHPDLGGDHDNFVTGLANLERSPQVAVQQVPPVVADAQQPWPVSLTSVLLRRLYRRRRRTVTGR